LFGKPKDSSMVRFLVSTTTLTLSAQ